jgi:hypothetical protein
MTPSFFARIKLRRDRSGSTKPQPPLLFVDIKID